ncbi:MAG: FAD-dependent oxidoreductase, partial [Planctomycetaceae bacterium]|nr:FAD-dependent oxidoreductase [Planctomycetaceae bacterium]
RTYPNFCRLLAELGVESVPTGMGFSVSSEAYDFEYCGSGLGGMFAQRRNLVRPGHYRMIRDILKFNRIATGLSGQTGDESQTVNEFLSVHGLSKEFGDRYLLPMGAAIWSCPPAVFGQFPVRFIAEFYRNHGLLSLTNRPTWRVVQGGSREYIRRLTASFQDRILLNTPVRSVERTGAGVRISTDLDFALFDEVVLACHTDQALQMLGSHANESERYLLKVIPYNSNRATLHTDTSVLPRRRRVWSSWKHRLADRPGCASLTYNMNVLQHLQSEHTFCVTLNDAPKIHHESIRGTYEYSHPVFTTERAVVRQRHHELIRNDRISCCGAWCGNGFHEDGVNSALRVAEAFQTARHSRDAETSGNA